MRFEYSIVSLFLVLMMASVSWAKRGSTTQDLKRVETLSSKAAVAFDQGDYNKAFDFYSEAHKLYPDPRITFAMVRCLESMGKYDEALKMIRTGLSENPDKVLKTRFESKASHLKALLAKGYVRLKVEPWGAVIRIDGKLIGKSPVNQITLPAGDHTVDVSKTGYSSVSKIIHIPGGEIVDVNISLNALMGQLTVTTTPTNAKLYVDGELMGNTPLVNLQLPVGPHELTCKAPGMAVEKRQITVNPSASTHLDIVMAKNRVNLSDRKGPWYKSWPGWTTLGLSVALGVTGGVFLYKAHENHNTVNNTVNRPVYYSQQQLQDMWNTANRNEKIGYGLIAGAGVALVTSTILFATRTGSSPDKDSGKKSEPVVYLTPQGVGIFTRF